MMGKPTHTIENHPTQSLASSDELKTHIAAYEAGGWNDGRLGLAYDLICEAIRSHRNDRPKRFEIADAIEALDISLAQEVVA